MGQKALDLTNEPKLISGSIVGKVVSKANSRRATRSGLFIKSADGLAFERMALEQIPPDLNPFKGDVALFATIYYPSLRQDLDESLVMDVLQERRDRNKQVIFNGVYVNDRQIKAKIILHVLDRENPRVEFTVVQHNLVRKSIENYCNDVTNVLV